jgi:hypothetical protein
MKTNVLSVSLSCLFVLFTTFSLIATNDKPPSSEETVIELSIDETSHSDQAIEKSIHQAILAGNAQTLSSFFFNTIELTLPDAQGTYSKAQAELLMRNFFSKNPPQSLDILNEGQSGGEKSYFAIGTYVSQNGKSFRMYYLVKEMSGKNQLTILKFE